MSPSRSMFLSGMILGIVLGFVLGHLTLWRPAGTTTAKSTQRIKLPAVAQNDMSYDLGQRSAELPYFPLENFEQVEDYPQPQLQELDEYESPLANAIALETVEIEPVQATQQPAVVDIGRPSEEPKPLDIDNAAPLEALESRKDREVRAVIEHELSNIPKSQRDVWYESLKDMSVDDVTGVIRMWKAIGGPIPGLEGNDFLFSATLPNEKVPSTPHTTNTSLTNATAAAFQAAIAIHERNLLMESTFGYVRAVPRFIEETQHGQPVVTKVVEEFDFTNAETSHYISGFSFDLMIHGSGMFLVEDAEGNQFLTRRGRFSINRNRELALIDDDAEYVLQPVISLPKSTVGVVLKETGELIAKTLDNDEIQLERSIQLAPVLSSTELRYVRNGLFKSTSQQPVVTVAQESGLTGIVAQGGLLLSNIDADHERKQIERLKKMLAEDSAVKEMP